MESELGQHLPGESEWTEVAQLLQEKYSQGTRGRIFQVGASVHGPIVSVVVTLRNEVGTFVYPVEGRLDSTDIELSLREAVYFLWDYIGHYFGEYFRADNELYLPIDWADYECDNISFQMRGQIVNEAVDRMADDWLARGGPPLEDNS